MTDLDRPPQLLLGTGILTWPAAERDLGRYGTVSLRPEADSFDLARFTLGDWDGMYVRLHATVTALRWPVMPTDPLLGVGPRAPEVGRTYPLGAGALFVLDRTEAPGYAVGTVPTGPVPRPTRWLDVQRLYDLHNHIVSLEAHRIADPPHSARVWSSPLDL
ncbi:hypothetical protein [Glycomyces sp. MUSA5-2]|uniref:hypothetical protein n=1 Tax=Glycomyces sp. MUSA5-2 TaxID=2053002 RepID=UPI00300A51CA